MTLTPVVVKAAFLAIAKTDTSTASVALRAALGAGTNSVLEAEDINVAVLPTTPFIALRWGTIGGPRDQVQRYFPTWWIYDALPQRWDRIDAILPLLTAAYPLEAINYCEIDYLTASAEVTDHGLNLRAKAQPFTIGTR